MQMAKSRQGDEEWSLKFFLNRQEFNTEAAMHHDRNTGTPNPLSQFLPQVRLLPELHQSFFNTAVTDFVDVL